MNINDLIARETDRLNAQVADCEMRIGWLNTELRTSGLSAQDARHMRADRRRLRSLRSTARQLLADLRAE